MKDAFALHVNARRNRSPAAESWDDPFEEEDVGVVIKVQSVFVKESCLPMFDFDAGAMLIGIRSRSGAYRGDFASASM